MNMYGQIYKYILLTLLFCLCVNGFKDHHSALDNQLGALSVAPNENFFPFHGNMSIRIATVLILFKAPCLRETVSQQTSRYSGSCNLSTCSSTTHPESPMQE